MKTMTTIKMLCVIAGLAMTTTAFAGDGTKDNPYTVAELNAQKDALATSGATVWVKADLKGLGEDGTRTDNGDEIGADGKTVIHPLAGLFGDETGTFVAYSFHILGQISISDWTNTKDLLISLNYGTKGHVYGNIEYPDYGSKYEPTDPHFSLDEVHGALTLEIQNGFRGYHIGSCYIVPKGMAAATVNANYTSSGGSKISYRYYNGSEEGTSYLIPKHSPMVLIAAPGIYDVILGAGLYDQRILNSNSMVPGKVKGENVNTEKDAQERWLFRFVATSDKLGFERNSDDPTKVTLEAADEIILKVNSKTEHFAGNWKWETADKKWISWGGKTAVDFGFTTGINTANTSTESEDAIYDLNGRKIEQPAQGLYIQNGKKYIAK